MTDYAEDTEEDDTTTNVLARHPYTNDTVGIILLSTLPVLLAVHGVGYIDLSTIPRSLKLAYVGIVGTAAVWMFGLDAVKTWMDLRS